MSHIDVGGVLRQAVHQGYTDLVTRSTGMAVRHSIERELSALKDGTVTALDFTHVGMIDYSCADEVVAKLLLLVAGNEIPRGAYVVVRGLTEYHLEAIEAVLDHRGLALVVLVEDGGARLVGAVNEDERRAWHVVHTRGRTHARDVAAEAGLDEDAAENLLEALMRRRLLIRLSGEYAAVGTAAVS
ncbi:MAG: hypothetical protein K2X99_07935 [Gemmatimonadaceae bacterium]|nr:hypothetical protein [Gemmatimonadaceae bacterium]